jgi:hypothetical protein
LLKDTPPAEIVGAMRAVAGEPMLSATTTRRLIEHLTWQRVVQTGTAAQFGNDLKQAGYLTRAAV